MVAIGDVDAIVSRVNAHLEAGADHVCVQVRAERSNDPSIEAYRELAAALGAHTSGGVSLLDERRCTFAQASADASA